MVLFVPNPQPKHLLKLMLVFGDSQSFVLGLSPCVDADELAFEDDIKGLGIVPGTVFI